MSLHQNCFPDLWKEAIVQPRLKKVELDASFANLRPVSNLAYISKLTEKAVFRQLHQHMASNNLYPTLQSAYRNNHNTESSLLKVFNDILLEMNNQNVTLLVFLDLSAAFDTIDHNILIARLNSNLGIPEPALSDPGSRSISLTEVNVSLLTEVYLRSLSFLVVCLKEAVQGLSSSSFTPVTYLRS